MYLGPAKAIRCDYCEAPAHTFLSRGPRTTRSFFCKHEDHREFAYSNVSRLPLRWRRYEDWSWEDLCVQLRRQRLWHKRGLI